MKQFVYIVFLLLSLHVSAQTEKNYGIQFYHGTWKEACDKAKAENKLIFVDFYTKWCGSLFKYGGECIHSPLYW